MLQNAWRSQYLVKASTKQAAWLLGVTNSSSEKDSEIMGRCWSTGAHSLQSEVWNQYVLQYEAFPGSGLRRRWFFCASSWVFAPSTLTSEQPPSCVWVVVVAFLPTSHTHPVLNRGQRESFITTPELIHNPLSPVSLITSSKAHKENKPRHFLSRKCYKMYHDSFSIISLYQALSGNS